MEACQKQSDPVYTTPEDGYIVNSDGDIQTIEETSIPP